MIHVQSQPEETIKMDHNNLLVSDTEHLNSLLSDEDDPFLEPDVKLFKDTESPNLSVQEQQILTMVK